MRGLFAVLVTSIDLDAPDFRQCRVRPAWNDIDDSGVVVVDAGGGVPGAAVVVRHNATGVTTSVVTNSQGAARDALSAVERQA